MRMALPLICLTLLSQVAYSQGETTTSQVPTIETRPEEADEVEKKADEANAGKSAKADKSPKAEKMQVTGSRIKRVDIETAAPTTILDRAMIERSGATNLGEVLKKSASLSPTGNFTGESRFTASGAATVDLLGLGASRTLVLLNGKRIPTSGSVEAVNIGNIPTGLIERIEIVAGANSAVYGADAVGGVVNIITKKRQDGGEVSVFKSSTIHPGGEESEITASQGVDIGSTNINFGVGYKHRNAIDKRNRDLRFARPGFEYTASNAPAGTYAFRVNTLDADGKTLTGNFEPSANCPAESQIVTNPTQSKAIYCAGRRDGLRSELIPEQENWYAATTFNSELGTDTTLSGILAYSSNENTVTGITWPRTSQEGVTNRYVRVSQAEAVRLGVIPADKPDVASVDILAVNPEARQRRSSNLYQNYTAGLYLDTTVADDLNLQVSVAHTANKLTGSTEASYDSDKFRNLVIGTNGQPAYNPIDPARDIAGFNDIYRGLKSREDSAFTSVDTFVGSDLAELPGGTATFGVGAAYSYETFKLTPDKYDQLTNLAGSPLYEGTYADSGEGNRTTVSAYTEVFAPVTRMVDLEGALRFDHFNDFASSFNY
ncbi:MAG: TonB-dependent receptor plug domain-containing protein, partial [Pseudobdellovibrionaceae bacterium]|nr:TonB-dependent receptor plug domain-containing protein [Pseudobdellovibrionaceae bacterium]